MTLGDMIRTLRIQERVEIRDIENNEICTCPTNSDGIIPYKDYDVIEWFPHGAPNKDATFTVFVRADDAKGEDK